MYDISDYSELEIYITNGWQDYYVPKFRLYMIVDEPICYLHWTDTEKGASGIERELPLDFNDVTFGYTAPSSASEIALVIGQYQVSAWTNIPVPVTPLTQIIPVFGSDTITNADTDSDGVPKLLEIDDTGGAVQIEVPLESTESIPVGAKLDLYSITNEFVDVVPETAGVTINSLNSFVQLAGLYAKANLIKTDTNIWLLSGNLRTNLDPDAEAYIDAMELAAGITIAAIDKTAINNLVLGLKADGLYSTFLAFYPMYGGVYNSCKFNLISPVDSDGAYRLSEINSPTWDATGVTGNASNMAVNTHIAVNALTQDDTCIGFVTRNSINTGFEMYGRNAATVGIGMSSRFSGNTIADQYNAGTNRISAANASSIGHFAESRTSSIVHKAFKNGAQIGATNTNASVSIAGVTATIHLLCINTDATLGFFSAANMNCPHIGSSLTDAQVALLTTRISNFNTAIGR